MPLVTLVLLARFVSSVVTLPVVNSSVPPTLKASVAPLPVRMFVAVQLAVVPP
jgi:hypothetical protein